LPPIESRKSAQELSIFLKKSIAQLGRALYRSRKLIFLVLVVVLVTLIFNFIMASSVNNNANNPNNPYNPNNDIKNRTISTTGGFHVQGLEIYGGDVKAEPSGKIYIDWGELNLGSSKKVSFYVKSTSNFDVDLGLNVTAWTPAKIKDYLNISWDYNGTVLSPNDEPLLVTLTLNVSSSNEFVNYLVENKVTSFGFDTTVYASAV
jgi:hypothetical protein